MIPLDLASLILPLSPLFNMKAVAITVLTLLISTTLAGDCGDAGRLVTIGDVVTDGPGTNDHPPQKKNQSMEPRIIHLPIN